MNNTITTTIKTNATQKPPTIAVDDLPSLISQLSTKLPDSNLTLTAYKIFFVVCWTSSNKPLKSSISSYFRLIMKFSLMGWVVFPNYSTFFGKHWFYVEDLFMREYYKIKGFGKGIRGRYFNSTNNCQICGLRFWKWYE